MKAGARWKVSAALALSLCMMALMAGQKLGRVSVGSSESQPASTMEADTCITFATNRDSAYWYVKTQTGGCGRADTNGGANIMIRTVGSTCFSNQRMNANNCDDFDRNSVGYYKLNVPATKKIDEFWVCARNSDMWYGAVAQLGSKGTIQGTIRVQLEGALCGSYQGWAFSTGSSDYHNGQHAKRCRKFIVKPSGGRVVGGYIAEHAEATSWQPSLNYC